MLGVLRLRLDVIDDKIVDLLHQRMKLVESLAEVKKAQSMPVCVPEEEARRLAKLALRAQELQLDQEYVGDIYASIFQHSRDCQERLINQ